MKRISSQRDFTIAITVFTFYLPRKGIFNIFNFKKITITIVANESSMIHERTKLLTRCLTIWPVVRTLVKIN